MTACKQIALGSGSYFSAIGFIFKNGLWIYFFYPLLIALVLFFGGIALTGFIADRLSAALTSYFGLDDPDSWFLSAMGWMVSFFINAILFIIFFYIKASLLKYFTLILLSPVMAHLSQRTAQLLDEKKSGFDAKQFLKDMLRGIAMALRNMLIEFFFIFIFFFVSFIPFAGWLISLVALSLVSWFFYGFSMIDYSNERKKLSVGQSTSFAWKNK